MGTCGTQGCGQQATCRAGRDTCGQHLQHAFPFILPALMHCKTLALSHPLPSPPGPNFTTAQMKALRVMALDKPTLRALVTDAKLACWYYLDPQASCWKSLGVWGGALELGSARWGPT